MVLLDLINGYIWIKYVYLSVKLVLHTRFVLIMFNRCCLWRRSSSIKQTNSKTQLVTHLNLPMYPLWSPCVGSRRSVYKQVSLHSFKIMFAIYL